MQVKSIAECSKGSILQGEHSAILSTSLKGTATLMITVLYMKDLNKPRIMMPVSSKLVEKSGSCELLNICKWIVMEAAIL